LSLEPRFGSRKERLLIEYGISGGMGQPNSDIREQHAPVGRGLQSKDPYNRVDGTDLDLYQIESLVVC